MNAYIRKNVLVLILTSVALAACSGEASRTVEPPQTGDRIRDSGSAIAIARKICEPEARQTADEPWRAELHDHMWRVWLPSFRHGAGCKSMYETQVRSADGDTNGCTVCVESDR